jgi:hypothetical protein
MLDIKEQNARKNNLCVCHIHIIEYICKNISVSVNRHEGECITQNDSNCKTLELSFELFILDIVHRYMFSSKHDFSETESFSVIRYQ